MVSFNYGTKNHNRVKESTKLAIIWSSLFAIKGLFLSQGISDLLTTIVTIFLILYISRKKGDDKLINEYS